MEFCRACASELPANAKSCPACGTKVAPTCGAFGAEIGATDRCCRKCGASQAATSEPEKPDEEHRLLTILFSDRVGSTNLSIALDPDDPRDVLRRYREALEDAELRAAGAAVREIVAAAEGIFCKSRTWRSVLVAARESAAAAPSIDALSSPASVLVFDDFRKPEVVWVSSPRGSLAAGWAGERM